MPLTNEKFDSPETRAVLERAPNTATVQEKAFDRQAAARTGKRLSLREIVLGPIGQALLLLLLVNWALSVYQPFAKVDAKLLPATHTWTWWATKEFFQQQPAPPVVMLGSSLFMHSVSREDADYLNKEIDYVRHHRSLYLEDQLKRRFGSDKHVICFNFSLPGDLISDDYMIARGLLHGNEKPKYIILGISLRDFIDNAVNCPGNTPPFRYLKRFTNIDDLVDLSIPQFWQQCDFRFGKFFYLWGNKLDLQALLDQATRNTVLPLNRLFAAPSLLNNLDYRKHVPSDLHSEVEEGMAIVKPNQPYTFDPNYADYRRRCGSPNERMFKIQSAFLKKLVDYCQEQGIRLIVLNMPLTKENLALMPKGSYENYLTTVRQTAEQAGDTFVDLNQNPCFVHTDFYDTAHMNSSGGKKLLDILAKLDILKF